MAGALFLGPGKLEAQAPVVLVCRDGTTQPGSSKVACADHKGMDWEATKHWTEMRAGHFAEADSVVCTDGQREAGTRNACRRHGGVDSVSTMAAVRRRAKAERFARQEQSPAGYRATADTGAMSRSDTSSMSRNDSSDVIQPQRSAPLRPPGDSVAVPDSGIRSDSGQ